MPILKLFISPQVEMPDVVLQDAGRRLTRYFDLICMNQKPRRFSEFHVQNLSACRRG